MAHPAVLLSLFPLNSTEWDHFMVRIEGVKLHYIHVKSAREDAVPILLSHGWPGMFTSVPRRLSD